MKCFLIIFSIFLIDNKLLKCSQQEPFHAKLAAHFDQIDKIKRTALQTIRSSFKL